MARVRIINGADKGQAFDIGETPLRVGRDDECAIPLGDKGASRVHAEFFRIGEMCFLRDLDSRNGTFVNDARVQEEMLRDGDRIQIGGTLFEFETGPAQDSQFEYSEDEAESLVELRLEDLSALNVGDGDPASGRHLRIMYRVGRMAVEARDEEGFVAEVLPYAGTSLRADGAYLFLRDPTGAIAPIGTWARDGRQGAKISRTIIRRAIQDRRAILTADAMQDGRFSARESIVIKGIHGVICVPLSVSGDVQGVLYLAADSPVGGFSEDELELATALANQVGVTLAHLRAESRQRERLLSAVRVLVRMGEALEGSSPGHAERAAAYALALGKQLGLRDEVLHRLQLAALLHGLGRIAGAAGAAAEGAAAAPSGGDAEPDVPSLMATTMDVLRPMLDFPDIEPTLRGLAERYDGRGATGARGAEIPLEARVLAVALAYESCRDLPPEEALAAVEARSGGALDPSVLRALGAAHRENALERSLDEWWALLRPTPAKPDAESDGNAL